MKPTKAEIRAFVARKQKRRRQAITAARRRVEPRLTEREIRDSEQRWNDLKHDVPDD